MHASHTDADDADSDGANDAHADDMLMSSWTDEQISRWADTDVDTDTDTRSSWFWCLLAPL